MSWAGSQRHGRRFSKKKRFGGRDGGKFCQKSLANRRIQEDVNPFYLKKSSDVNHEEEGKQGTKVPPQVDPPCHPLGAEPVLDLQVRIVGPLLEL